AGGVWWARHRAPRPSQPPPHTHLPAEAFNVHVRSTPPRTPEEERLGFHVPPGFEVQLFAAEPEIGKPVNMAFDHRGRLWVTQTVDYPRGAGDGAGHDRVVILEDTDHDGRADRVTTFADGLNIPVGVVPVPGGAIVYSIPYVYRFFDL